MSDKRSTLMKKYAPLTNAQLKAIVAAYLTSFPGWSICQDGTAFERTIGPIRQMIWFQKMGSASYRPTHVINTTVLSMPRMLHQVLDVKHREVELRWHESKFNGVVSAMEQQFKPEIRNPLDISEILVLCEKEARLDFANDLTMLAILYAWLDRRTEALECCERIRHCPLPALAPIPEWEEAMRKFASDLSDAIMAGNAKSFLATEGHS